METPENTSPDQKPKRDKLFIYLFFFMTAASVTLGWLYWIQKSETDTVITENIQITSESEVVKRDLQQLQTEYETLQTNDVALQKEIEEKRELITQLQAEAEKHKNDRWIMAKLKKETVSLRSIMQHFVVEIDSLNMLNKKLIGERDSVTTELHTEKQKYSTLQGEKERIYKMGSLIKASDMKITALHVKSETNIDETQKAKRTDKIRVAFKLEENNIAPKGERTLFVRIVMPDGKEWAESADADHMFIFGEKKGFYAMKKSIRYENKDMYVEMLVRKKENAELLAGKYLVEVVMDNSSVGSATLELE